MIIVALASMPLSPPLSAFAQRGHGGPSRLEGAPPIEERTPLQEERTDTQTFGGREYHGQLAWTDGRWRQEVRDGSGRLVVGCGRILVFLSPADRWSPRLRVRR